MYRFHYEHIKLKYPDDQSKLCFTDTDSFLYRLKTQNIYNDMLTDHEWYDFSNFKSTHQCFNHMTPQEIQHIQSKIKKVWENLRMNLREK